MTTTPTATTTVTTTADAAQALLRRVLVLDAAGAVAGAGLLAVTGPALAGQLGASSGLLRGVAAVLVTFALVIVAVAARRRLPPRGVATVVVLNAGWVVGSLALVAGAWVPLTALGVVVTVLQALVVAGFAVAETAGLRRLVPRSAP